MGYFVLGAALVVLAIVGWARNAATIRACLMADGSETKSVVAVVALAIVTVVAYLTALVAGVMYLSYAWCYVVSPADGMTARVYGPSGRLVATESVWGPHVKWPWDSVAYCYQVDRPTSLYISDDSGEEYHIYVAASAFGDSVTSKWSIYVNETATEGYPSAADYAREEIYPKLCEFVRPYLSGINATADKRMSVDLTRQLGEALGDDVNVQNAVVMISLASAEHEEVPSSGSSVPATPDTLINPVVDDDMPANSEDSSAADDTVSNSDVTVSPLRGYSAQIVS